MSFRNNNKNRKSGKSYFTPKHKQHMNKLRTSLVNSFTCRNALQRGLYGILVDTSYAEEITFQQRKAMCYDLLLQRTNEARAAIYDEQTGKPLVSPASFTIFDDEICKLITLQREFTSSHTSQARRAALNAELAAYKQQLCNERIIPGSDFYQEREAKRAEGQTLVLPDLLTNPNAIPPKPRTYSYDNQTRSGEQREHHNSGHRYNNQARSGEQHEPRSSGERNSGQRYAGQNQRKAVPVPA